MSVVDQFSPVPTENTDQQNGAIKTQNSPDDSNTTTDTPKKQLDTTENEEIKETKTNDVKKTKSPRPLSPASIAKKNKILRALKSDCDVSVLRQLAINRGGMLTNELRRLAWPKQLGVDLDNISPKPDEETLKKHRDYEQVVMDVNRSLKRFPPGMEDEERFALQDVLIAVIMRVLVSNSQLHYYQGFHDICVTFLLVVEEDVAFALVEKLTQNHLRDFMDRDMERTKNMLNYLYPIINKASPNLGEYMERAELGTIFCLSWLITWYGHVLNDIKHIVRLYDFFIACHQLMPIYLAAAIVLYRQDEIFSCECEMCFIHSLLSRIPDNLPFEELISQAGDLFLQFPPKELANEAKRISEENAKKSMRPPVRTISNVQKLKNNMKWVSAVMPDVGRRYLLTTAVAAAITAALCYSTTDWGWIEFNWF